VAVSRCTQPQPALEKSFHPPTESVGFCDESFRPLRELLVMLAMVLGLWCLLVLAFAGNSFSSLDRVARGAFGRAPRLVSLVAARPLGRLFAFRFSRLTREAGLHSAFTHCRFRWQRRCFAVGGPSVPGPPPLQFQQRLPRGEAQDGFPACPPEGPEGSSPTCSGPIYQPPPINGARSGPSRDSARAH